MKLTRVFLLLLAVSVPLFSQSEFSQESAAQVLRVLSVEIGPRPMGSPAEHRALEFAVRKFREYGCDTSYIMPMDHTSRAITTSGIAVGIKRGATGRIICIGGHIDSAGPEVPGADDDGSGSATVIELARTFSRVPMQSTLLFCCFGGEEAGLEGSRYFVEHFGRIDSIALMLQIDMANGVGIIDIDPDTHGASAPRWLTRAAAEEFFNLGYTGLRYPTHFFSLNYAMPSSSGSDHESFLRAGIPAIDFSTDVAKPIHTPRDNFENFDPRGLRRSGDLIQKIVKRFDGGVPDRTTERYWLYLLGRTPIFLPLWVLWIFFGVSITLGAIAFADVRKRREPPDAPNRIRWSGIKIILFSLIIVSCAWFSSDVVGMINGTHHPAVTDYGLYQLLAAFAAVLGLWLTSRFAKILPLSRCPYVFFKRTAIWLTIMCILFALLGVKVAIYPASALFFLSLAILSRHWASKILFALLAPVGFFLFLFHEWFGIIAHSFGEIPPVSFAITLAINSGVIALFTVFLVPVMYGFAAVARDTPVLQYAGALLGSKKTLVGSLAACIALSFYLIPKSPYNPLWYRDVRINQQIDLSKHSKEISVESSEYLSGVQLHYGNTDTIIEGKTQTVKINPPENLDTTWLTVNRREQKRHSGDTTTFEVELSLSSKYRPYIVTVSYSTGAKELEGFSSPAFSTGGGSSLSGGERGARVFRWTTFPDTNLALPVQFQVVGNDSVREKIEVAYDKLAYPVECKRELTYFIGRTRYLDEHIYKN